jgi:hypothetical protein
METTSDKSNRFYCCQQHEKYENFFFQNNYSFGSNKVMNISSEHQAGEQNEDEKEKGVGA